MLFLIGCKKSNHDMLLLLGDESYLKSIDEIYPRKYRFQWPDVSGTGEYSIIIDTIHKDTLLQPPINEGLFPPELNGEYQCQMDYINGNYEIVDHNNNTQPYPGSNIGIRFIVSKQNNGYSDFEFYINNQKFDVDNASIYGNKTIINDTLTIANFLLCFEYTEEYDYVNHSNVTFGIIIMGDNQVTPSGNSIKNLKYWALVKDRYWADATSVSYVIGGQRYYKTVN